jgi:hypothetical protein
VKAALDQLIESHHAHGTSSLHGHRQPGAESRDEDSTGGLEQSTKLVVDGDKSLGESASHPLLVMRPDMTTIRLKPNEVRHVAFDARPHDQWSNVSRFALTLTPPVKELEIRHETQPDCATVDLKFVPGADFDEDEYPIETTLRALAAFNGQEDARVCERRIVINRPRVDPPPPPPPPPVLRDDPTYLRVTSRQPVRMTVGGPDVHVKLKWDGKDELVSSEPAQWRFMAHSKHPDCVPTFTRPVKGRFELLLRTPSTVPAGEKLDFHVEAVGPGGRTLTTAFSVDVIDPPEPRRVTEKVPGGAERKPPYKLRYIFQQEWGNDSCWGGRTWGKDDPGCFQTPTSTEPLNLIINQDYGLLAEYRESLVSGRSKLAEATVQGRITRYTSHVAFHIWQMYEAQKQRREEKAADDSIRVPDDEDMSGEIRRVAATLVKLMRVSH